LKKGSLALHRDRRLWERRNRFRPGKSRAQAPEELEIGMPRGKREHALVLLVGSRGVLQRHIAAVREALDEETVA
jgi:hypothetical protein